MTNSRREGDLEDLVSQAEVGVLDVLEAYERAEQQYSLAMASSVVPQVVRTTNTTSL